MTQATVSAESDATAPVPRRGVGRAVRLGLLALAALVVVAVAGLWWLLATTGGARWALERATARGPAEVSWGQVEGRLIGPLGLRGVRYGSGGADDLALEVDSLEIEWQLRGLVKGRLMIERLLAAGVRVELPPEDPEVVEEAITLPDIALPFDVSVAEARLEEVSIVRHGGALTQGARLDLAGQITGDLVEIRRFVVEAPSLGAIEAAGTVEPRGLYPLDLVLSWRATVPELGEWAGSGQLKGDSEALHLVQTVTEPLTAKIEGEVLAVLEEPRFEGHLAVASVVLTQVSSDWPALRVDANADLSGTPDDYALTLRTNLVGVAASRTRGGGEEASGLDRLPLSRWTFSGRGSKEELRLDALQGKLLGGTVEARGTVGWVPRATWDLGLEAKGLDPGGLWPDWPGTVAVEAVTTGEMAPDGPVGKVQASKLAGTLREREFEGQLNLVSEGQRFRIEALELDGGLGQLQATGEVAEEWDLYWQLRVPDLSAFPEAAGSLAANGTLVGRRETPRLRARLEGHGIRLASTRAEELNGQVDVSLEEEAALRVELASRRLEVDGRHLESAEIEATGTILDHQIRVAAATEDQALSLQAVGSYRQESWEGRLTTFELVSPRLDDWRLEQPAEVTISRQAARLSELCGTSSRGSRLCLRGAKEADGRLRASGELVNLPVAVVSALLSPQMTVSGNAVSGRFTVARQASFQASPSGDVPAEEAPAEEAPAEEAPSEEAPSEEAPSEEAPSEEAPSEEAPSEDGAVEGDSGLLTVSPVTAEFRIDPVAGTWRYFVPTDEPLELKYRLHATEVELTSEGLTVSSRLDVAQGRLELAATLPGYRLEVPLAEQRLAGHIRGEIPDLWWLAAVFPVLEDVEGRLDVDLELSGTAAKPVTVGQLQVVGGAVIPELGLELTDVEIEARSFDGEALEVLGSVGSGEGELSLTGSLPLPPTAENPADLRLVGRQFLAVNTPDTQMWVSMDLETRVDDEQVAISGRVRVPKAMLAVASGPTAVPVSADAVIVGGAAPEPRTGPTVVTNLNVELGEDVRVTGDGFGGQLTGQLAVRARPDGSLIGTGELLIRQGTYTAYGQNLAVDDGRVTFTSSPIDNPGLNIRAYREAQDDVIAGLHIRGTVLQPVAELYSVPALPQMDALSYLLFGRLNRGGENPDLATSAALSLGLAGSKAVLGRLGLDQVTIDSGAKVDDAALVLGTYIGPDLFVSYGVGLFRSLHILRLRYDIDRHWSLQAEQSQEDTAGDILYSIER